MRPWQLATLRTRTLNIGDAFTMRTVTFDELFELFDGRAPKPTGPTITVRIVGVGQLPDEVSFTEENKGILILTRAFLRTYGEKLATLDTLNVRLRRSERDIAAFSEQAIRLAGSAEALGITTRADTTDRVENALRTQAGALVVFAFAVGIAAFLLLGQALARAIWRVAQDDETLVALGMTRFGRIAAAMIAVLGVALGERQSPCSVRHSDPRSCRWDSRARWSPLRACISIPASLGWEPAPSSS